MGPAVTKHMAATKKPRAARFLLATWARRVVRARLARLGRELARLDRKPDPDAIHDVRVASRRLRAALRHLAPCFPAAGAGKTRDEVRVLARLLGEARDLDILVENLTASGNAARGVRGLVPGLRSERHDKVRRALPVARRLRARLPALARQLGV